MLFRSNVGEVWARLSIVQALTPKGAFFTKWEDYQKVPVPITREDVIRRIGLRSNYSTLTRAKWITTRLKPIMDDSAEDTLGRLPSNEDTDLLVS